MDLPLQGVDSQAVTQIRKLAKVELIPFIPDQNAEVVLIRVPPVRNQAAVLVQASGRRQIIAVLQDGCAVGCSLAIAINQPFSSILNRLPTEMGEEPKFKNHRHSHPTGLAVCAEKLNLLSWRFENRFSKGLMSLSVPPKRDGCRDRHRNRCGCAGRRGTSKR